MASAIDLFAGAGGFALAAQQAGCTLRLSVEIDEIACMTLEANFADHEVVSADAAVCVGADLRERAQLPRDEPLLVIGGPPCQPFSKAAYWVEEGADSRWRRDRAAGIRRRRPPAPTEHRPDDRRSLVEHFARLVVETDADGFVFENVPSVLHPRNRPIVDGLLREMDGAGYQTTLVKALASEFGVAQHRERVFVLGSRHATPIPPAPTHAGRGEPTEGRIASTTTCEALQGLEVGAADEPEVEVTGRWAQHLREIPPGWNYKFHTAWAGHENPTFEAERRFWNFLLVLDPDKPSWTIPANPGPWVGPFHWEHRRLTTPEMAALQGFPPHHRFMGDRRDRVRQIGNAVPPSMAAKMIESVVDAVSGRESTCAA